MSKLKPKLSNITYISQALAPYTFGALFERRAAAEKPQTE